MSLGFQKISRVRMLTCNLIASTAFLPFAASPALAQNASSSAVAEVSQAAQDPAAPPAAVGSQAAAGPAGPEVKVEGPLEEIVVTAQRREEVAQDVPISITAISAKTMERQRIQNPMDLQMHVPSLVYNEFVGYAQPYLRGIGTDISQPNADPSVATYIDGIYVANAQGVLTSMLGVERVEVLVGPQGTLYGRNAVGGAINYYTPTPNRSYKSKLVVGYGNYDRKEISGFVSGPVSDKLSLGFYGAAMNRDTYLHRDFASRPDGEPKGVTELGARVKARYDPTETFGLTVSAEILDTKSPEADAYRQIQPTALGYVFGAPEGPPDKYHTNADFAQYNKTRQYAVTAREELDLGFANLLGITGYRQLKGRGSADYDATSVPLFSFGNPVLTKARQFSQELQLLSPKESKVDWIAGLYYFTERAGQYEFRANSAFLFQPANNLQFIGRVSTTSMAAFGQVTYPIAENLRLTGGLRYSIDRKKFDGEQRVLLDELVLAEVPIPNKRKKWSNLSPKITLDYRVGGTLIYGTFSKGYKAGVFNVNMPTDPGPVDPEEMDAFEIGHKSDLLKGRLRINTALYHYKIRDLQVQTVRPTSGGSTVVQNAASATLQGIDITVLASLTPDLTVNLGGSYSDAKYKNFEDFGAVVQGPAGNSVVFIDAGGNRLARAPKYTFAAGADYEHEFGNGAELVGSVKAHYNDGYFWDPSNLYAQDSYWLVNASVSYRLPRLPLTISVWGSNLTNQFYNTILNPSAFGVGVFDAPPRMFGATLTWRGGSAR